MNAIAGALTVVPVYFIGRRLFDEATGIAAAAITALLPSFVFWTPVLLSDVLFTLIFACALATMLYAVDQGRLRPRFIIIAGLLIGLGSLIRGQALILVPITFVCWLIEGGSVQRASRAAGAAAVVALLVIAPWAIRNQIEMDAPIVLSANFGYNLRVGHAPYSTGRYIVPQDLWDTEPGLSFHDREAVFNDLGTRRAMRYTVSHPIHEISLAAHKIVWLWRPDSDALDWTASFGATALPPNARQPLLIVLDAAYAGVLLLAGISIVRLRERGRLLALPLLLVASWTGLHIIFLGEPRYHLPMLVVLVPLAADSALLFLAPRRFHHAPSSFWARG